MPDPLPDWVDEDRPAAPASRRRATLLALAALPWVVVLALVLAPDPAPGSAISGQGTHAEGQAGGRPVAGAGADLASPAPEETASGTEDGGQEADPGTPHDGRALGSDGSSGWEIAALQGAWRAAPGDGESAALATAVARAWLTGVPPLLPIAGLDPPPSSSYAEHLVVEAIERPAVGAAVVTVLAVLLDTDDGGATGDGRIARLAVPILEDDDGPRPGGAPWHLPGPELSVRTPGTAEVTDPALRDLAVDALHRAGFEGAELLALGVGDGWPWVARFRRPDAAAPVTVWLRRHLDRFVVTGLPLRTALGGDDPPGPGAAHAEDAEDAPVDGEEVAP